MDTQNFNQPGPERFSSLATLLPLPMLLNPYKKGMTFESFEAVRDALLQCTVARGLSYKADIKLCRRRISVLMTAKPRNILYNRAYSLFKK